MTILRSGLFHQHEKVRQDLPRIGTLWMSDDPAKSVTDTNGRFHHVANAYCIGQALFPTVGSANPTLTGLTLTRKVASHIATLE